MQYLPNFVEDLRGSSGWKREILWKGDIDLIVPEGCGVDSHNTLRLVGKVNEKGELMCTSIDICRGMNSMDEEVWGLLRTEEAERLTAAVYECCLRDQFHKLSRKGTGRPKKDVVWQVVANLTKIPLGDDSPLIFDLPFDYKALYYEILLPDGSTDNDGYRNIKPSNKFLSYKGIPQFKLDHEFMENLTAKQKRLILNNKDIYSLTLVVTRPSS